jgi:hypothetical protein
MASPLRQVSCPCCGRPVAWEPSSRFRPFCSERCRTMDLGAWAAERHRIAGEPAGDDATADQDPKTRPGT